MRVQELVEKYNIEGINLEIEKELDIKKYIPVMEKRKFATDVISLCMYDIDDYVCVNRFKKNIYFSMKLLSVYTNLDISDDFDDIILEYDMLCESGLFDKIVDLIDDYVELYTIFENELDELLEENRIERQVAKVVNKINESIDIINGKIQDINLPEGTDITQLLDMIKMLK